MTRRWLTIVSETVFAADRERLVGLFLVADILLERQIAGLVRPHQRRAGLERRNRIDHRRHRLPLDRDGFGGVARLLDRIGDDERDRVADVAHFLAGEDFVGRRRDGRRREWETSAANCRGRRCPARS